MLKLKELKRKIQRLGALGGLLLQLLSMSFMRAESALAFDPGTAWQRGVLSFPLGEELSSEKDFQQVASILRHLLKPSVFVHQESGDEVSGDIFLPMLAWVELGMPLQREALSPAAQIKEYSPHASYWVSPHRDEIRLTVRRLKKKPDKNEQEIWELQTQESIFTVNLARVLRVRHQVSQGRLVHEDLKGWFVPRVSQRTQNFAHIPYQAKGLDLIEMRKSGTLIPFIYYRPFQVCNLLSMPADIILFDNVSWNTSMIDPAEEPSPDGEISVEEEKGTPLFDINGYSYMGLFAIGLKEILTATLPRFRYTHAAVVDRFDGMETVFTWEKYPDDDEVKVWYYSDHGSVGYFRVNGDFVNRQEKALAKISKAYEMNSYRGKYCSDFAAWAHGGEVRSYSNSIPLLGSLLSIEPTGIWSIVTPDDISQSMDTTLLCQVGMREKPEDDRKVPSLIYPRQIKTRQFLEELRASQQSKNENIRKHATFVEKLLKERFVLDAEGFPLAENISFQQVPEPADSDEAFQKLINESMADPGSDR